MIRPVKPADIPAICNIYNHYVRETIVTFEEHEVSIEEMTSRIDQATRLFPWFVYEEQGKIMGYTYAQQWKTRSAYRLSVECTIYMDRNSGGKGIGTQLYNALIADLKKKEVHVLLGVLALPNEQSIALHEKLGFVKCGHFNEVGRKFDRWIDVGYWQRFL